MLALRIVLAVLGAALSLVVALNGWLAFVRPRRYRRLRAHGREVEGTIIERPVIDLPSHDASIGGGRAFMLVVEFTDERGGTHLVKSGGASSRAPELGQRVRVAYDPADPAGALIERDIRMAARVGMICLAIFAPMAAAAWAGALLLGD